MGSLLPGVLAQWSSPAPLLRGNGPVVGLSLVAGGADTVWAAVVVGQAGSTGPHQVLAGWTTGDTWSLPVELTPRESGRSFSAPGMGRDPEGRIWVAWYRGDYPTYALESSAVWATFRDSAGWRVPARVCSGVPAQGPMSFAADAAGNWYLGFTTLTPYLDRTYSSAVYSVRAHDSWQAPRYIARGRVSPMKTDFCGPVLATRPDSGIWAAFEMSVGGDVMTMLSIVIRDTARWCWTAAGRNPTTTVDSIGRLWVLYSQPGGYLLQATVIVDSVAVNTMTVSDLMLGRAYATTDFEGLVWAAWQYRAYRRPAVNYTRGGDWAPAEMTTDSIGVPLGIATDATGRVCVVFQTADGQLYSVHRLERPGVSDSSPLLVAESRRATVVRGRLVLPWPTAKGEGRRATGELLDMAGRRVMTLHPGANDVTRLSAGVYFVSVGLPKSVRAAPTVQKIVIKR